MRINPISLFSVNKYNFKNPKLKSGLNCDVFQKSQVSFKGVPFGVDKSCIEKSKDDKAVWDFIRPLPYKMSDVSYISTRNAIWMKDYLDEKYGEKGYVFVSLGTSPAGIAKALEFMGEDVRYVPISDVRYLSDYLFDFNFMNPKNIERKIHPEYKKYLDTIGINKEKIGKDKKHYVICDYAHKGTTLQIADYVMKNVFKINEEKFTCLDIKNAQKEYYGKHKNHEAKDYADKYLEYCSCSEIEPYVGIPHIPYNKLYAISEKIKEKKEDTALGFELLLCRRLREMGLI